MFIPFTHWLKNTLDRWAMNRLFGGDLLSYDNGDNLSELQKGQFLLELTRFRGWGLLKGLFVKAMVSWGTNATANRDTLNQDFGTSRGLGLGINILRNVEKLNLKQLEEDEKADKDARDKGE